MQRVVVFMGGPRDAVAAVQHSLPASVRTLARAGVYIPRAGRAGNKAKGASHQQLTALAGDRWAALKSEVKKAEGDTVFLVIPAMVRLGGSPDARVGMVRQLTSLADEVCLVSVVGEQLTTINDFYLSQVGAWRVSRRLDAAAPRLLGNEAFLPETLFRPWYEDHGLRFLAVPLPVFAAGNPISTVLRAAGVDLTEEPQRSAVPSFTKLGSVGVEANRLLATYLKAAIPGFQPDDDGTAAASRSGLARAEKLGWCVDRFWGWTRLAADAAVERLEASNDRFARAVWGTSWDLPYPLERRCTQVDFLDLDFQVVDQVHRYVLGMAGKVARERAVAS